MSTLYTKLNILTFVSAMVLVAVDAAADSYLLTRVTLNGPGQATSLTLIKPFDWRFDRYDKRLLHVDINKPITLTRVLPRPYTLRHVRLTGTNEEEWVHVSLAPYPEFHVRPNTIHYIGDIVITGDQVRFGVRRETLNEACQEHAELINQHTVVVPTPEGKRVTFETLCKSQAATKERAADLSSDPTPAHGAH